MSPAVASRILVAYDGSEPARRALDRAADLAGYGTTVTVVGVANGGPASASELLDDARTRLAPRRVPLLTREANGKPGSVAETAEQLGADLIVVGTDASAALLEEARCDVLVVR